MQGSNILFLTNCHATPWQAHMHRKDVHMSFLDCSPSQWYQATRAQNVQGAIGTFSNATLEAPAMSEQRTFERDPLAALCRVYGCGYVHSESSATSVPRVALAELRVPVDSKFPLRSGSERVEVQCCDAQQLSMAMQDANGRV